MNGHANTAMLVLRYEGGLQGSFTQDSVVVRPHVTILFNYGVVSAPICQHGQTCARRREPAVLDWRLLFVVADSTFSWRGERKGILCGHPRTDTTDAASDQ
jgi:hypothetical protein